MLFLNRDFFIPNNIVSYINISIQTIIQNNPFITADKEYWLYYYIKEDFSSCFYSLYNIDIDTDCLGFSIIRRNTRHAIESFLDLVNLSTDPEYLSILEYSAKKGKYNPKYQPYIKGKIFNIPAKYEIATKMYNKTIPSDLLKVASENNEHIHPNIFIDVIDPIDYSKKAAILKKLLSINFYLFTSAYQLILQKYNNNNMPLLNCISCTSIYPFKQCDICYKNECAKFQNLIENALFTYNNPTYFNTYQNNMP